MNVKQAKQRFTLRSLLSTLGHEPYEKKSKGDDLWYFSPFRPDERTPSFHINDQANIFKDFGGAEKGGDLIRFAQLYLKNRGRDHSVSNVLRWMDELNGHAVQYKAEACAAKKNPNAAKEEKATYTILSDKPIYSKVLFQYLEQRLIPKDLALKYLRQVYFQHNKTGKKIFGLGSKCRGGGYDIRNPHGFKTMIGNKDITIIAPHLKDNQGLNVFIFEGIIDFLSYQTIMGQKKPFQTSIILNSTSLYNQAADYIKDEGFESITLWQDNDRAGEIFKEAFVRQFQKFREHPINITSESRRYEGYKDINDWLIHSGKRKSQFNSINGNVLTEHLFKNYQFEHNFLESDLDDSISTPS